MKVKEFYIEPDKQNKGSLILVAVTEDNQKFVVAGDTYYPTHLVPYQESWHTKEPDNKPLIPPYEP